MLRYLNSTEHVPPYDVARSNQVHLRHGGYPYYYVGTIFIAEKTVTPAAEQKRRRLAIVLHINAPKIVTQSAEPERSGLRFGNQTNKYLGP
jgi:hypothetical protein